jgi:hypothetical protein
VKIAGAVFLDDKYRFGRGFSGAAGRFRRFAEVAFAMVVLQLGIVGHALCSGCVDFRISEGRLPGDAGFHF